MEKPAEPDALAHTLGADPIHPVVPVAGAHERKAVTSDREAPVERASAVLEERGALRRNRGLEIGFEALVGKRRPIDERNLFVKYGRVPRDGDVVCRREGEPDPIVGNARSYTPSRRWMPPVLDIAFRKLPRRRATDLPTRDVAGRHRQRHDILELIAETVRAARLIEARTGPD